MKWALSLTVLTTSSAAAEEVFYLSPTLFAKSDIVIVGEQHDQPTHHQAQADIIAALSPTAVVFEMLTAEQASRVTPRNKTDPDLGATLGWEDAGWPDFAIYAPIFTALGPAEVVGAAPDAETVAIARESGAATAINNPEYGLHIPLPESEQLVRETEMQNSHCGALPPDMLPWFVDQQRFADAAFTRATLAALDAYGSPVVVITGNGHARTDWGMPVYLDRVAPDVNVLAMGQLHTPDPNAPFDIWTVTKAVSSGEDPCAAFQ